MMLSRNNRIVSRCGTICGHGHGHGSCGTNASATTVAVATIGLRILMRKDDPPYNVVVKSSLSRGTHLVATKDYGQGTHGTDMDCCFLRTCALCRKKFGQDEDIYMYSSEGYCSIECRDRQIKMEEMNKLQDSTERMTALPGGCSRRDYSPATNEVRLLKAELRRRRDLVIAPKTRILHS